MYQCTNGNIGLNLPFIPHYIATEIHNRLLPRCKSNNEFHLIKGFYYQLISACNGSFNSSYRSIQTYSKEFLFTERLVRRAISLLTDTGLITCQESPFGKPSKTYQLKPVSLPLPVTEPKPETVPEPKPETVSLPLPVPEPKPETEALPKPEAIPKPETEALPKPEAIPKPETEALPKPEAIPKPETEAIPKPEAILEPERIPEPKLKPEAILEPKLKHLSEPVLMFKRKPVKISEFEPLLINEPERQIKATCTCGKPTTEFELKRWGVCSECFISSPNEFYKQCLRA